MIMFHGSFFDLFSGILEVKNMNMLISVIVGGLVLGCTYGMLSLGYSLIYQASGYMNFTQATLLMFGSFLAWQFLGMGIPFIAALFLAVIIMFFIGWMMERFVIRILVNKKAKNVYVVLATLALSIIMENAAMLIWDSRPHYFPALFKNNQIKIAGTTVSKESLLCIAVAFTAMLILHFFLNKTKFGTAMRAAAQSKTAASCMGINVNLTIGMPGRHSGCPHPICVLPIRSPAVRKKLCRRCHRRIRKHIRSHCRSHIDWSFGNLCRSICLIGI